LMAGKLLAQLGVGLITIGVYVGLGFFALFQFAMLGLVDPMLVVYLVVFYILGYAVFGAVMMAIGGAVRGGIYGTSPNLNPNSPTLENNGGDVRYETDFRSVYARVLENWLGTSSVPILGGDFRAGAPAIV